MKKSIALTIPVIFFTLWVIVVFFRSINSNSWLKITFSTLGLVITIVLTILITGKLKKQHNKL